MKYPITFFIFLCFFSACKKGEGNTPNTSTAIFPDCIKQFLTPSTPFEDATFNCCNCPFDWEEVYSSDIPYDYLYPSLNPNNNDQIVYLRRTNNQYKYQLLVTDFCNQETRVLTGDAYYGVNWAKNGWIFYTAIDQNIYKIKSTGDSLTQLTFTGDYNRDAKINPAGTKCMYQKELDGITYLLNVDLSSGEIDTIKTTPAISAWNWIDNEKIFYILLNNYAVELTVLNITNREEKTLHKLPIVKSLDSLIINAEPLLKENSILWCAYKVVGKTDLSTGQFKIILKAFKQEEFLSISKLSNETGFLLNKRVKHQIDNCHIDSDYDFYLIGDDGLKQEKIQIPD